MNLTNLTLNTELVGVNTIKVVDVYKDVCTGVDSFIYKAILLIFVFYLSSKVLLPVVKSTVKTHYPLYLPIYNIIDKFYYSLTETLALCSISLILILNTYHRTGSYINYWLVSGLILMIISYFIIKKNNKLMRT